VLQLRLPPLHEVIGDSQFLDWAKGQDKAFAVIERPVADYKKFIGS
jgi:hypothetical protein